MGTGTGCGIVINGKLLIGDNSAGAEINRSTNFLDSAMSIEETLSIRGIKRLYCKEVGMNMELCPEPFDIYKIGIEQKKGNKTAAIVAWETFGIVLGEAIANAVTLVDGLVVIGGGLSGAHPLFMPKVIEVMNGKFVKLNNTKVNRLETSVYNLDDDNCFADFLKKNEKQISIPFTNDKIYYSDTKKIGIGISKLGTSDAVAVGAYAYAEDKILISK